MTTRRRHAAKAKSAAKSGKTGLAVRVTVPSASAAAPSTLRQMDRTKAEAMIKRAELRLK